MIVDCALYEAGRRAGPTLNLEDISPDEVRARPGAFVWLGLYEPTPEELATAAEVFDLHPLAVEDAYVAHQRPKLEEYGEEDLFVVMRTLGCDDGATVETGEILCFVSRWYIVVVRHGEVAELETVRRNLENHPDLLSGGPSAVLHEIADRVVDAYGPMLDNFEESVASVELEVFSDGTGDPSERIYKLKRQVVQAVGVMLPMSDVLNSLASDTHPIVVDAQRRYFRDVHDHAVRALELAFGLRELLTSVLEANLARLSVRQNEDMRKISAWVAIFVVPTFVAGIYGMNFENMPELHSRYGYYFVLGGILLLCTGLYGLFRRSKWL
ncbi:MAG: magnesium/cobalt transporter CorA [Acidimicrobiia bacterium]